MLQEQRDLKITFLLAECVLSFTQERLPHTLQGTDLQLSSCKIYLKLILSNTPARTNENALFCFRAMAAEKGIFHGKIVV